MPERKSHDLFLEFDPGMRRTVPSCRNSKPTRRTKAAAQLPSLATASSSPRRTRDICASGIPKRVSAGAPINTGPELVRARRSVDSPDAKLLANVGGDDKVHLWDLTTGQAVLPQTESHASSVRAIQFRPTPSPLSPEAPMAPRPWDLRAATSPGCSPGPRMVRAVTFDRTAESVFVAGERLRQGNGHVCGLRRTIRPRERTGALYVLNTPDRIMAVATFPGWQEPCDRIGSGRLGPGSS